MFDEFCFEVNRINAIEYIEKEAKTSAQTHSLYYKYYK